MDLSELRKIYHQNVCSRILHLDNDGIPNIADKSNSASRAIAIGIVKQIAEIPFLEEPISGQTAGSRFEQVNREFLQNAFQMIQHLRPAKWVFDATGDISRFQQYRHLADLARILEMHPELKTAFGTDYLITPDVIIARYPVTDDEINQFETVIPSQATVADLTPLRATNHIQETPILHASVSVKWTIRSDRAQNARTESLNLIRNRKGHTPRIVAVTAEPTPSRLASLALGTGDIDCVYHFALPELRRSILETGNDDTIAMLENLVIGERIRDISDLPLDLII